jgi:hypothetical protein
MTIRIDSEICFHGFLGCSPLRCVTCAVLSQRGSCISDVKFTLSAEIVSRQAEDSWVHCVVVGNPHEAHMAVQFGGGDAPYVETFIVRTSGQAEHTASLQVTLALTFALPLLRFLLKKSCPCPFVCLLSHI